MKNIVEVLFYCLILVSFGSVYRQLTIEFYMLLIVGTLSGWKEPAYNAPLLPMIISTWRYFQVCSMFTWVDVCSTQPLCRGIQSAFRRVMHQRPRRRRRRRVYFGPYRNNPDNNGMDQIVTLPFQLVTISCQAPDWLVTFIDSNRCVCHIFF